jgi:CheY-like chemotaxis protein
MNKIKTVLLVEDDVDDQDIFKLAVDEINPGIQLMTASNGADGLELLSTMVPLPDIIFLDLNMPRVDGKEFLRQIKVLPDLSHIPVAIYTTSGSEPDKIETRNLGAHYFLTKPDRLQDIVEQLSTVII